MKELMGKNVLFTGQDVNKVNKKAKEFITLLAEKDYKVFLLDAFWSREKYNRFKYSRYRDEIERRYHIKISVNELLDMPDVFDYIENKGINIVKVKSIVGYMSAAELAPVIISKINEDISSDEKAYVLINDFVLKQVSGMEFSRVYSKIKKDLLKFIFLSLEEPVVKPLWQIIDENIIVK